MRDDAGDGATQFEDWCFLKTPCAPCKQVKCGAGNSSVGGTPATVGKTNEGAWAYAAAEAASCGSGWVIS